MDNLEHQPAATPAPSSDAEVQGQVASLASLLHSVLILLFVLSGVVDFYLWRQAGIARDELVVMRQFVGQAAHNSKAIEEFARKLAEYGKTHPDFAPIAAKYNLKPTAMTNTAPASGLPAPAPAAKAPKAKK